MTKIILASTSAVRRKLLKDAGYEFEAISPGVDEDIIKDAMLAEGASCYDIADALAELKAVRPSARNPDRLIIGADQTLEFDGRLLSKCSSLEAAAERLSSLQGTVHKLHAAVVIAENGRPVWRHVETAVMTMRSLTEREISSYLDLVGKDVLYSTGAYAVEKEGIHLFESMKGDHTGILGLPMVPLVSQLRRLGVAVI